MPSPYSIDRSAPSAATTHRHENATPEIKTAKHRNKSISLMQSAGKSAASLFNRLYNKISARLPALFKGKTKYVVTPGNPALLSTLRFQAQFGKYQRPAPAFEEYASARQNLRSSPMFRFEPQLRDVAEIAAVIEPTTVEQGIEQYIEPLTEQALTPTPAPEPEPTPEPAPVREPVQESAPAPLEEIMPPVLEAAPDEAPDSAAIVQGNAVEQEEDAPPPQLSVRQRVAQFENRGAATPSPRSVFMNSQLAERDTAYLETLQMFDTRSREEPPLRPFDRNRFRSGAYLSTAGRQNVSGTGFANRSRAPQNETPSASAQGVWPLGIPDDQFFAPKVSLKEAVAAWYPLEQRQDIMAAWRDLAPEDNPEVQTFSDYLVRLGNAELNDSVLGDVADLREFVQALLTQVSHSPDLLAQVLSVTLDGTTTCDDRVLVTFNQMPTLLTLDKVKNGFYDNRLPDLITAGRRQFRLERLQDQASIVVDRRLEEEMATPLVLAEIARAGTLGKTVREEIRARLLAGSEELETHLLMQIDNARDLDLDLPIKKMRFRGIAKLSSEQRIAAGERVKKLENDGLKKWLVQWTPWLTMLERQYAVEYAKVGERKNDILELVMETLDADVDADIARMQAAGELNALQSMTPHEIRELRFGLEKARTEHIESDALVAITDQFLQEQGHGHGDALNPHWQ